MNGEPGSGLPVTTDRRLELAVVLQVAEDTCEVVTEAGTRRVRFASMFPAPRTERVSPGHLVAIARASAAIVWRWYDAVIVGERPGGLITLWEPAHGEVSARPRPAYVPAPPGTRAYVSAGLPGADWWVAGRAIARASEADVDLSEVARLYTEHDLWDDV